MPKSPTRVARKGSPRAKKAPQLSRLHPPDGMALSQWQIVLRQQFGRAQSYRLENLGSDPLFSDFRVVNPDTDGRYRVTIRGSRSGSNRCSCGDYVTNELGTCKHIEFVLSKLERRRGAMTALRRGSALKHSELWLQQGLQRHVCLNPGSSMPAALRAAAAKLFEVNDQWRLPERRFEQLDQFIAQAKQLRHIVRIADEVPVFVATIQAAAQRRQLLAEFYPQGAADTRLRDLLKVPMFRYQIEGALFAVAAGRALIADEMGLGKTVQAIAAAEIWQRMFGARRLLVICPTSLKAQWAHELQRFAGRKALIVEGNAIERARHYAAPADCKIASYDSLTRDLELANAWRPDILIVDEAQRVKNWDTQAARALKRLDSRYAVVLTGTPLENRLEELLSVVQLVDRHRLGPTWRFLHEHQMRDEHGRVIGYRELDRIGQTLAPILIRRRKHEVLDQLPTRSDQKLFVALTPLQRQLHDEQGDVVARIVAHWRRQRFLSDADQKHLQASLQKMRMACNSSYLLDRKSNEGSKIPELLAWLDPRLDEDDTKAVIFSAWLGTHELIAAELDARGVGYVHFNGSVPARERARRVERFNTDPTCRIFLATDAGGVGLNLQQAASLIVNMDLPWNPAVLEQRIGRVYRLGQKRRVEVLNMVASNSIEENMLGVLSFKRALFEGALDGGGSEVHLQGTRLSRFMQSVEALTAANTATEADMVHQAPDIGDDSPAAATDEPDHSPPATMGDQTPMPVAVSTSIATNAIPTDTAPIPVRPSSAQDPTADTALRPLLQLASSWLQQLTTALDNPGTSDMIERDTTTGRATLRLPLPEPDQLRKLADMLQAARSREGE